MTIDNYLEKLEDQGFEISRFDETISFEITSLTVGYFKDDFTFPYNSQNTEAFVESLTEVAENFDPSEYVYYTYENRRDEFHVDGLAEAAFEIKTKLEQLANDAGLALTGIGMDYSINMGLKKYGPAINNYDFDSDVVKSEDKTATEKVMQVLRDNGVRVDYDIDELFVANASHDLIDGYDGEFTVRTYFEFEPELGESGEAKELVKAIQDEADGIDIDRLFDEHFDKITPDQAIDLIEGIREYKYALEDTATIAQDVLQKDYYAIKEAAWDELEDVTSMHEDGMTLDDLQAAYSDPAKLAARDARIEEYVSKLPRNIYDDRVFMAELLASFPEIYSHVGSVAEYLLDDIDVAIYAIEQSDGEAYLHMPDELKKNEVIASSFYMLNPKENVEAIPEETLKDREFISLLKDAGVEVPKREDKER